MNVVRMCKELKPSKYAIIDVGSNSMRLVIYSEDKSGRLKEVENIKLVARLRNDLSDDLILQESGIKRLISYLHSFQEVTRFHQLKNVRCVATAAIRHATNQDEILERVKKETDFTMRVLSDYEEAYFGYIAVVQSMPFTDAITIDIGGGSTEVTLFKKRELIHYHSFPFGALTLKKQFVLGEAAIKKELQAIRAFVVEQFETLSWLKDASLPIIGIGGSARNVVRIHQESINYPLSGLHQYKMNRKDVEGVRTILAPLTIQELQKVDGLSKDRADIICPALEVFQGLADIVHSESFVLSRNGLRDGVLFEERKNKGEDVLYPSVVEQSFHELGLDYEVDTAHAKHRMDTVLLLAQKLCSEGLITASDDDLALLKQAAFVYNVGAYIDEDSGKQHTFYLLANRTINGLLHKDRIKLSLLASFKNKSFFKQNAGTFKNWFTNDELCLYQQYGAILTLANSFHSTKRNIIVDLNLKNKNDGLTITATCDKDWKPEQYQVEKQKKHLEKQIKKSISVEFVWSE